MADAPATLAERVVAAMMEEDRATAMLGMRLLHAGEGTLSMEMTIREDMLNGHRICHGGILFALADTVFGIACNTRNARTVVSSGQIEYLRPALKGDVVRATAVERSVGRRLGIYDVELSNQHEQTIALFRGRSARVEGAVLPEAGASSEPGPGAGIKADASPRRLEDTCRITGDG